ncbi:MAG TPA: GGDEF domain-containing protein [Luteimonas sp.]|nr:GGDEF domain-containing protein [Luteimonas sp.]
MEAIDVAIFALFALLSGALGVITWLVQRERLARHRVGQRGWALGLLLQSVAVWMHVVETGRFERFTGALAPGLLLAGYVAMTLALLRAQDRRLRFDWLVWLAPLALALLLAFSPQAQAQRMAVTWLLALLALAPLAPALVQVLWRSEGWAPRWVALVLLLAVLVCAAELLQPLLSPQPATPGGALALLHVLALGWLLMAPVVATFAFLLQQYNQQRALFEGEAGTDALTGTRNRRAFLEQAERTVSLGRSGGRLAAWLTVDIDGFKAINDRHGREVGDVLLAKVADELKDTLRGYDIAGRFGGDEFCALLFDVDAGEAGERAERLRQRISARPIGANGALVFMTISIGVAHARADRELDIESLMRVADRRLYYAKRSGRNRVVAADADTDPAPAPVPARLA